MNSRSVIIADRLLSVPGNWNDPATYESNWSKTPGTGTWYTAWNDNHVEPSTSVLLEDTQYGKVGNTFDNLYDKRIGTTQWGNVQTGGVATDGNNSGTRKIAANSYDGNIKPNP